MAAQLQKEQGLPGLVVASVGVSEDGIRMRTGAYGEANIGSGEPMTTDTPLWLASTAKVVLGTAMAKAKEQSHIMDYTTKASDILSQANSFALGNNETGWLVNVTLEDLATHRSTIRDNPNACLCGYYIGEPTEECHTLLMDRFGVENVCVEDSPVTLEGILEACVSAEGAHFNTSNFLQGVQPGEVAECSNYGAGLAGHLIALASGVPLPECTSNEIFDVLGMSSTSFHHGDLRKIAFLYQITWKCSFTTWRPFPMAVFEAQPTTWRSSLEPS